MNMEINNLILEIAKITLEKNQRERNTIFLHFAGHCKWFEINVYKKGWEEYCSCDYEKRVFLDLDSDEDNIKALEEILDYLINLD